MVASHPRCIVKPYLGWLTDSGFDPSCAICNQRFDADDTKECVRLICLDVFHWDCLDKLISAAPPTTAPSGFRCPSCEHPIIPQRNQGGPVAEALRSFLNRTLWAANNPNDFQEFSDTLSSQAQTLSASTYPLSNHSVETNHVNTDRLLDPRLDVAARQFLTGRELTADSSYRKGNATNSVISSSLPGADSVCPTVEPKLHTSVPWSQRRDMIHSIPTAPQYQHHFVQPLDDDDKYKRRVALGGLARFFSARIYSYLKPSHLRRPRAILSMLALFAFLVVLVQHLHSSGSSDIRGDPLFDAHMNPNIHLDEHAAAAIHGGVRFNPEVHG